MSVDQPIVNRVAASGLISFDLEEFVPKGERVVFDLKEVLFEGIILREKDFRAFVKQHDWDQYADKNVAITCTTDAIIPTWAYMLVASKLSGIASDYVVGGPDTLEAQLFQKALLALDIESLRDKKVVVKGCSNDVPQYAYAELTRLLQPVVSSLMFGEPCSTVPVYKRPK